MTTAFRALVGCGPVEAHTHPNGGGWVADTALISPNAFIGRDTEVFGNARVYSYARPSKE